MQAKITVQTLSLYFLFGLMSCESDIDLNLPEYQPQVVIECYLENQKPVLLSLSESQPYFDTFEFSLVQDAVVILHQGAQTDTIPNIPYANSQQGKLYNYSSSIPVNKNVDLEYTLEIFLKDGRYLTATTRFLDAIPIQNFEGVFNEEDKAYCLTQFQDPPSQANYYRLAINRGSITDSTINVSLLDDSFAEGDIISFGSPYEFDHGDTVSGLLFHCTEAYYQYLSTLDQALQANVNPFSVSGEVISNVEGGLGIFTTLNYSYETLVIP